MELAHRAQRRGDVTLVHAANPGQDRFDRRVAIIDDRPSLEESLDVQDDLQGKLGDMGPRGFDGLSMDPFGLPNKPSGVGITVRDAGYLHGQYIEFLTSGNIAEKGDKVQSMIVNG